MQAKDNLAFEPDDPNDPRVRDREGQSSRASVNQIDIAMTQKGSSSPSESEQSTTTVSADGKETSKSWISKLKPKRKSSTDMKSNNPKVEPPAKQVGSFEIFKYSDWIDFLLMFIGTIAAIVCGVALPVMIIVLGDMTNSFMNNDRKNLLRNTPLAEVLANSFDPVTTPNTAVNLNYINQEKPIEDSMRTFAYYYIGIGVIVLITGYLMIACWVWASSRQTHRIRLAYFKAILRQDIGWYDTITAGELATKLSEDVNKIQAGIGDKVALFFMGFAAFVAGFVIGFAKGWQLTLVILAFTPLLGGLASFLVKFTAKFSVKESDAYSRAGAVAEEALSSIRTVLSLGAESRVVAKYEQNLAEAKKVGTRKGIAFGLGQGAVWFVIYCAYCVAFWYGAKMVRESLQSQESPPAYDGGTILTVFFAVLIGAFSLGNATPSLQDFAAARGAAAHVFEVIQRVPSVDTASPAGQKPSDASGKISFQNVAFSYPARKDVPILRDFNLKIEPGKTVALVGPSGCGKSTTIQLLQRFYDVDKGSVLVDDINIKDWNLPHLRNFVGVVSQEPMLFATTIAENIRYGRQGVTQDDIEAAAKKAYAHDFIMELPKKYETVIGERGSGLSGGQKQRIAIARAIVREPRILLLDEATSPLDVSSEKLVQAALDEASKGRTTIIIAHRLSTVRNADRIIAIENGEVIEEGTHGQLMERKGLYHKLVMNQANSETKPEEDHDSDEEAKEIRFVSTRSAGKKDSVDPLHDAEMAIVAPEDKSVKSPVKRVFRMSASEWPYMLIGWLAAMINGGTQPLFAILFSEMIRVFVEIDLEKQAQDALTYSLCFIAIGVAAFFSWLFQHWMFAVIGENLTFRLRKQSLEAMLRQEIGWFDRTENGTGALTVRLSTDASAVQGVGGIRVATVLNAVTLLVSAVIIAFVYSWKLTLVILAFIPLVIIGGIFQVKVLQGQAGKNQKQLESAGRTAYESIENFKTVTMLGLQEFFYGTYKTKLVAPRKHEVRKAHISGLAYSFSQAVIYFAYAAAFTFGAYLITNKEIDFAGVFRVFGALVFCAMGLGNAFSWAPDYNKALEAANRIFTLLDRVPAIDSSSDQGRKLTELKGDITFKDVLFAFPTRPDTLVLRGLNVSITEGKTLALVGHSGCGKSTTISLVERFYDVSRGILSVDGVRIDELNLKWLRSKIGFVQQEPVLFSGTVKENILFGCHEEVGEQRLYAAAKDANIHDFIMSLPNRYDTYLGERGSQLSGGQKQRIAIARAIITNPKILLLDEATSALDTESEKVVQAALDRAQEGRTCIVIAHRLNTIQNSDKICVIAKGKVIEEGTHSQLMAMKGQYWKSFSSLSSSS